MYPLSSYGVIVWVMSRQFSVRVICGYGIAGEFAVFISMIRA